MEPVFAGCPVFVSACVADEGGEQKRIQGCL